MEKIKQSGFDIAIVLASFALILILIANLVTYPAPSIKDEAPSINLYEITEVFHNELKELKKQAKSTQVEYVDHFEEEVSEEMNCLMYACVPIGRYYITAYNDEETACKITASGIKCHEGAVTTCAADVPKYFKFGDYIEVNGRLYRVEDTGSAVKKKHIDLFFDNYKDMVRYGSNYQTIYRVEFPFGKPKE